MSCLSLSLFLTFFFFRRSSLLFLPRTFFLRPNKEWKKDSVSLFFPVFYIVYHAEISHGSLRCVSRIRIKFIFCFLSTFGSSIEAEITMEAAFQSHSTNHIHRSILHHHRELMQINYFVPLAKSLILQNRSRLNPILVFFSRK